MFLVIYQELYLKIKLIKQTTYIVFAKNQLFLSLISLSLLATDHSSILQHTQIQSFNKRYRFIFNLSIARSLSFGFYFSN